jgi:hypothetical protein
MTARKSYFLAAAFFTGYLLVSNGVPWLPVLAGVAAAALFTWWRKPVAGR